MAIVVRNNLAANNSLTQLNRTSRALSRNFEHVSSGLRIARSADDAAGLGVAENLRALHRSADVSARNINDGISVIGVAEGATNEVANILVRLRELAVQSSSETLENTERSYIQDESQQLVSEIDRIASVTEFNGVSLADGTTTTINVQVGVRNTTHDRISITLGNLQSSNLGVDTANLALDTAVNAQAAITTIDAALDSVGSVRSGYGAVENRLGSALNNIEAFSEGSKAAESRIRDADFGVETAALTQNQILQQAGVAILSQAKNLPQSALSLLQ
jgi:flagellin